MSSTTLANPEIDPFLTVGEIPRHTGEKISANTADIEFHIPQLPKSERAQEVSFTTVDYVPEAYQEEIDHYPERGLPTASMALQQKEAEAVASPEQVVVTPEHHPKDLEVLNVLSDATSVNTARIEYEASQANIIA